PAVVSLNVVRVAEVIIQPLRSMYEYLIRWNMDVAQFVVGLVRIHNLGVGVAVEEVSQRLGGRVTVAETRLRSVRRGCVVDVVRPGSPSPVERIVLAANRVNHPSSHLVAGVVAPVAQINPLAVVVAKLSMFCGVRIAVERVPVETQVGDS